MSLCVCPTSDTSFPIHPEWVNRWCPSLPSGPLRDELLRAERMRERVEAMITTAQLGALDPPCTDFAQSAQLEQAIATVANDALDQIGRFWMAPRLVAHLVSHDQRANYDVVDRTSFEAIFEFRNHIAADLLPDVAENYDFKAEGNACLFAWVSVLPPSVSARMKLALPYNEAGKPDRLSARAALFCSALDRLVISSNDVGTTT